MTFGTFRSVAALAAASLVALASAQASGVQASGMQAGAQPSPAQGSAPQSGSPLNLPQNATFVGRPQETNVARATAIINDDILTRSDIDHRLALRVASYEQEIPAEQLALLRAQVLRDLIDETLQIQAAAAADIKVDDKRIDQEYARVAERFGHTTQTFAQFLRSIGSSERSLKRQIRGNVAWQLLLRRMSSVSVTDEEVSDILARLNASRGLPEYRVAEIYLPADEGSAAVRSKAAQLVTQIRGGAPFQALARQNSRASTAAVGGDLGWVKAEQLPPELAAVVQAMPVGAISDPVQVPGGVSIVALVDSRQVLTANPRDAVLNLMQMAIQLPPGTTEEQARARAEQLAQATRTMGGCGGAAAAAQTLGAELVANDNVRVRELPPFVQQTILDLNVGQATTPFGSIERISVLVLCGRDDPQAQATPTRESIANALEEERMQRQAQRYLRDLRRDAVIEYR